MRVIRQWFKTFFVAALVAASLSAQATSDITLRDVQALRGVKAVVLLEPELDEASVAAGVTSALVARRAATYLRDIGVQLIDGTAQQPLGDRGETPSVLLQFAVAEDDRQRPHVFITLNVLRAVPVDGQIEHKPIYIVQQRGLTRHKVTRNFLMRELDLALNMLREDLRRANR